MNLNLLRDKVHENAVKHGFWEGERSIAERLALIHSEVSEALEADRVGRDAGDLDAENGVLIETLGWKEWFESYIKDTFEDELADVVIRCLDLCGHLGIDVDKNIGSPIPYDTKCTIPEHLFFISRKISNAWCSDSIPVGANNQVKYNLCGTIYHIILLSKDMSIDIEKHIELKMKYNESREYKHGKRY